MSPARRSAGRNERSRPRRYSPRQRKSEASPVAAGRPGSDMSPHASRHLPLGLCAAGQLRRRVRPAILTVALGWPPPAGRAKRAAIVGRDRQRQPASFLIWFSNFETRNASHRQASRSRRPGSPSSWILAVRYRRSLPPSSWAVKRPDIEAEAKRCHRYGAGTSDEALRPAPALAGIA